ncbi:MAG: TIGR02646 family protein [Prevotellaceae bacterium]|nr:TIGR02646 family protein [Prevotellaceae bacterium]
MSEWKKQRNQMDPPQSLSYNQFDRKAALNEQLRKEQHFICCYCQQRITHFQGDKTGGAHNEHLIPEKGVYGIFEKQMDYQNLYACCIDSRGLKKKERSKRHCGEAKEDKLIRGFIQEETCSSFFRYNTLGEIIPNGPYRQWKEYLEKKVSLSQDLKEAVEAIDVLNLNCHSLVADRKAEQEKLIPLLIKLPKATVNAKIAEYEAAEMYPRYLDMLLYFMKQKK